MIVFVETCIKVVNSPWDVPTRAMAQRSHDQPTGKATDDVSLAVLQLNNALKSIRQDAYRDNYGQVLFQSGRVL